MKLICVDFDGVIHACGNGWPIGSIEVSEKPIDGSFDWLQLMLKHYKVAIYSSRSKYNGAIESMQTWFLDNGFPKELLLKLEFPTQKPNALIYIDDRAFRFEGIFPTFDYLQSIEIPWNRK